MSNRVLRSCETCRQEFRTKASEVAKGWGRFCSQTCKHKSQARAVCRACETCGKGFQTKTYEVRIGKGRFCSKSCGRKRPLVERFWEKVSKSGPVPTHQPQLGACWIWLGSKDALGYGKIFVGSDHPGQASNAMAHRLSFFLEFERWPAQLMCHHCDTPSCVNPSHLFEGSDADNTADREKKCRGRQPSGVANGKAVINEDIARDIAEAMRAGERQCVTMARLGLGRGTVAAVRAGHTWSSVTGIIKPQPP